jgi:hypothetical protein
LPQPLFSARIAQGAIVAAGRFGNEKNLHAHPCKCPNMIRMYRKEPFEKFGNQIRQAIYFDPNSSP